MKQENVLKKQHNCPLCTEMNVETEDLLSEIVVSHRMKPCFTSKEPVDLRSHLFQFRVKVQEFGVI